VVAFVQGAHVDTDDLAFLDPAGAGMPMDNHVVDGMQVDFGVAADSRGTRGWRFF